MGTRAGGNFVTPGRSPLPTREFQRPTEEDERRALIWLTDVREHGGPLERVYAASIIQTLAHFEEREKEADRG